MVARIASIVAFAAVAAGSLSQTEGAPRIHSSVHRALRAEGTVNLVATFKDMVANPIGSVHETSYADRGSKIKAVVTALQLNTAASQSEVASLLAKESASTESLFSKQHQLWISNTMIFKDANFALVEKLATLSSIVELREEKVYTLPQPKAVTTAANTTDMADVSAEWGVQRIRATDIWAKGNTGEGIIVGHIDSGVRATHETIKANQRCTHSWYDAENKTVTPYDSNGHGTHTLSIAVGSGGVGVAPGATWISCKGCRGRDCSESDLLACGQWMTCPTKPDGSNPDCSKAPHLVSNSVGGPGNDPTYKSVVDAWLAAGIIPIFANGNDGPSCTTVNSPGEYPNVIAVGATDSSDALAYFSSRGPTLTTPSIVKPDISAPGDEIRAAWNTSDTAYNTISGTSMATPHVSGVVALLLNANPGLTFDDVRSLLTTTTNQNLPATDDTCGDTDNSMYPNNQYGYGLIDALAAVDKSLGVTEPPTPAPSPTEEAPTPEPTPSCDQAKDKAMCLLDPSCTWSKTYLICY